MARRRIYHLAPTAFEELADWVGSFEALWEQRLDSLEDVLAAMQTAPEDAQTTTDDQEDPE